MYNYGIEGDDMMLSQQSYSQQVMQQPLVEEVYEPSPRGEEHTPLVAAFSRSLLRTGTVLKAVSIISMIFFYYGFGGRSIFTFQSHPEMPQGFHLIMTIFMSTYLCGSACLGFFQAFVADDSKYTIGFRTGSKMLSGAVMMDMMAAMLRLVQYLYLYNYLNVAWWTKFNVTKSEWTLFTLHNFLDGLCLCSYGLAFFYMEVYHDAGTTEQIGWTMLSLFTAAGFFLFTMIFTGFGAVFMLFCAVAAHVLAAYWASLFEPLLSRLAPEFHSRCINTDIIPGEKEQYSNDVNYTNQQMHAEHVEPPQSMYGQYQDMGTELPTSYDYSQLHGQVMQDPESGVVNAY